MKNFHYFLINFVIFHNFVVVSADGRLWFVLAQLVLLLLLLLLLYVLCL